MYQNIDHQQAPFPQGRVEIMELLFLRTWQATSLVKFFYYLTIVLAFAMAITVIVEQTILLGVGGFFLGLLWGVLYWFFLVLGGRISAEIILSIFSIRDSLASNGNNTVGQQQSISSAPKNNANPTPQYQDL